MRFVAILLALWVCGAGPASAAAAWRWPLDGPPRVTRGFDPPDTPYGAGHRGVDLAGVPGEAVRAAGAGRIGFAGVLAGRGVVTVLHAGGLKTTYEPVHPVVRAGQAVTIGQLIGRLEPGHAGCPVAACLHWGLLRGKRYLDPLSLVGAGHIRLLPLGGAGDSAGASAASSPDARSLGGAVVSDRESPAPGPAPDSGSSASSVSSSAAAGLASVDPPAPGRPNNGWPAAGVLSSAEARSRSVADRSVSPSPMTVQLGVAALGMAALLAIRRRGP